MNSTFCNRASGKRFRFGSDFIDYNHFGHVIFDSFDHHRMLQVWTRDLHAAAGSNSRVWDVTITGNFVRSVDNDYPLVQFGGKDASAFSQQRGLPDAGPAQQQKAFSRFDHVAKHVDGAIDGPPDTARQSDNLISPIAKRGNTMKRSLDTGTIVFGKRSNAMCHVIEVFTRDRRVGKVNGPVREPRLGKTPQIQNDLDKIFEVRLLVKRSRQMWRHHLKQEIEVIRDFFTGHLVT